MEPKFITGEPAILAGRTMVISDMHIGIEYEFRKAGINMPSQTHLIKSRLNTLIKETKPKRIIFLGDVKHKVPGISWQEKREVPELLAGLANKIQVEIVPGNHDGGLESLLNENLPAEVAGEIIIHPSSGVLLKKEKIFLAHGHAWPDSSFLEADYVVTCHNHPQIEFKSKLGYRWNEPVWIKAMLRKTGLKTKYGAVKNSPELIIMPAFNQFSGGSAFNVRDKEKIGPLAKAADMKTSKAFLLDGTYLGKIKIKQ